VIAGGAVAFHRAPTRANVVLWAFADGFGRIYERLVLVERLRAHGFDPHEEVFRGYDGSRAAAIQLDMIDAGVVPARVEVVAP